MVRGSMFTAETRPRHGLEPEERLLLAVLEQAVADLNHRSPAVRADADAYLFSESSEGTMFSFDAICDYFQLSPTAVRVALRTRFWHSQQQSVATSEPDAIVRDSSRLPLTAAQITSEPPQTFLNAHDWTATSALLESTDARAAPFGAESARGEDHR